MRFTYSPGDFDKKEKEMQKKPLEKKEKKRNWKRRDEKGKK